MIKTTGLTVRLDDEWSAEELHELANVLRILERIPEANRASALAAAQNLLESNRRRDSITLVWSKP